MSGLLFELLNQGVVVPLAVALVVGFALSSTRFAWLAVAASFLAMTAMTTGFAFTPLTAARKVVVLGIAAPLVGAAADAALSRCRHVAAYLALAAGLAVVWAFFSVLRQSESAALYVKSIGVGVFGALLVALVERLREDGTRLGAAGVGLGIATGVSGVLSASVGYLIAGAALSTSAGALLIVQVVRSRDLPGRLIGALSLGVLATLFAVGAVLLAEAPWYTLPTLLVIPLAAGMTLRSARSRIGRAAWLCLCTTIAAIPTIAVAWLATRSAV